MCWARVCAARVERLLAVLDVALERLEPPVQVRHLPHDLGVLRADVRERRLGLRDVRLELRLVGVDPVELRLGVGEDAPQVRLGRLERLDLLPLRRDLRLERLLGLQGVGQRVAGACRGGERGAEQKGNEEQCGEDGATRVVVSYSTHRIIVQASTPYGVPPGTRSCPRPPVGGAGGRPIHADRDA